MLVVNPRRQTPAVVPLPEEGVPEADKVGLREEGTVPVTGANPGLDGEVEVHAEIEVEVAVAARDRPIAESHQPLVVFGVEHARQRGRPAALGVLQDVLPVVATDEGVETPLHVREVETGPKAQIVLESVVLVPGHSNEGAAVGRFQLLVQAIVAEQVVEPQGCLTGGAVEAEVQPVDPRSPLQVLGGAGIGLLRGGLRGRRLQNRPGARPPVPGRPRRRRSTVTQTAQRRPGERRERRSTLIHGLWGSRRRRPDAVSAPPHLRTAHEIRSLRRQVAAAAPPSSWRRLG